MKRILFLLCAVTLVFNSNAQEVSATYDPDVDGDNNIGVTDLLALLSLFSENDLDDDGIWDSQDDCVGEYDECGVCNGEGIPEGYCTCDLMIDALGECGGDCASDFDGDGVCDEYYGPCAGLETVTFDGYTYDLVAIGDQCWFAENLRTEHYDNGDAIPGDLSNSQWSNADDTNLGAQAIYNNDASNLTDYGRLYNWYAVDDARGLCPSGWHVPTDGEYTTLTDGLGGTSVAGAAMKSSPEDSPSWDGTNTSGFSGLAGGYRGPWSGNFYGVGDLGFFWSASGTSTGAFFRELNGGQTAVNRNYYLLRNGFSVRCIKDE